MPIAAGPQAYQTQFSPFTKAIFRIDTNCVEDAPSIASLHEQVLQSSQHCSNSNPSPEFSHEASIPASLHLPLHRGSITSDSTNSSPTTTISTVDSSSATDPSPSSSPESPIHILPLSSFTKTNFQMDNLSSFNMSEKGTPGRRTQFTLERPMTSPGPRKPRNAKGLALCLPSFHDAVSVEQASSSPITSPTFVKPMMMKPRKKPSILSLQTSGTSRLPRTSLDPPPTPGGDGNPMLRHHHSSPQITSSPRFPPNGGMNFSGFERSKVSGLSNTFRKPPNLSQSISVTDGFIIEEEPDYIRPQMASRSGADVGGDPFDKAPNSQEMDSHYNDYNEGPVLMHAPSLYLYKEPTAKEAMEFDVIINVAAEVANPFDSPTPDHRRRSTVPKLNFDPREIDILTPSSVATFQTALEWPVTEKGIVTDSPTTPKPVGSKPEYIHIKWEHNSTISKDLLGLCELIDQRTKDGKKVLVHCLQGISRSASLIIAYGLYLNPSMSVTQAHDAAKQKSEWITPNMKLIFQIQEFQSSLVSAKSSGRGLLKTRGGGRASSRHRNTLSADVDVLAKEPLTAPLPFDKDNCSDLNEPVTRPRGLSTPFPVTYSPGPSSAPSAFGWSNGEPKSSAFRFGDGLGESHLTVPGATTQIVPPGAQSGAQSSTTDPDTFSEVLNAPTTTNSVSPIISDTQGLSLSETHKKSDSFAAFDFGFNRSDESCVKYEKIDEPVHQEARIMHLPSDRMDTPTMPGSFPRSPDVEVFSAAANQPRSTKASDFNLHCSTSSAQTPNDSLTSTTATTPTFTLNDTSTIVPPSPGLFSPRTQEFIVKPIADTLAIQQSRAEGPKKDGLSMYDMMSPGIGGGFPSNAFEVRPNFASASVLRPYRGQRIAGRRASDRDDAS